MGDLACRTTGCVATLGVRRGDQRWRWELPRTPTRQTVAVDHGPTRCLRQLRSVDRVTDGSVTNFAVSGRYEAAEALLDSLWSTVVAPLLRVTGDADHLRFRLPRSLARLPVSSATSASTGESLVHIAESVVEWPVPHRTTGVSQSPPVVRLDGHQCDVAARLRSLRLGAESVVLLMGCRTAELLPMAARSGAGAAIATSWDVEDRHCERFAGDLERLLGTGLTPEAALRSVQASWSNRHPYEWAGYSAFRFVRHSAAGE